MSRMIRFTLAHIQNVDPDWWDKKGVPIEQAISKRKNEPVVKESEALYLSKESRGLINQIGTLPSKGKPS